MPTGEGQRSSHLPVDGRRAAAEVAGTSARAIETLLDHLVAPMLSLANYVHVEPHWPTLNASFDQFARAVYTEFNIEGILQDNSVILLGPWYADGELSDGAFVVRYSIFLPPGEWDMPPSSIHVCPWERCNTPNNLTWWGFSNAVFAWKTVAPAVERLGKKGLLYTLSPDPRAQNQSFLAKSDQLPNPSECMVVTVNVYNWMAWTFCVEPVGGFGPSWRIGLLVGVTALAVLLAALVGLVLRSRQKAVEAHGRQLELNRQLAVAKEEAEEGRRVIEAEKQVTDALLQRQRNLIALFGKEDDLLAAAAAGGSMSDEERVRRQLTGGSSMELSRESATYDRIEALRRQLTTNRSSAKLGAQAGEDLKLGEILGEGSFGKVFKGEWRGTEVAVKTMVLPANMSGAEKREKMLLMEIATGAALTHPHVVQARNVMLKSAGAGDGRGVICKVADFGLSVKMDTAEQTHMSGIYQGTLTHMAPEVMLLGRISKAADVYAYGITLWELFVGGQAFHGVPRALLGHQIHVERKRPSFPPFAPEAYTRLAYDCWAHTPEARPTFEMILERLAAMRAELPGPAAPLGAYRIGSPAPPPRFSNGGAADSGVAGLPKLPMGVQHQVMSATSNPVFDASHFSGSGGSGSGITWPFPGSVRAPALPVVIEENEHELSSRRLPLHPDGTLAAGRASGDARAVAELDASNTPLAQVVEGAAP
ncbi:Mitogen-activated protein kinase kinase kinase 11 [Tetrabaena socialis]|uniref:Mitogen-activated protein kinase kinase kinase 11 n=1 Tax=Tetrabaena socialis TaxID=47790 RepID=A0A2J8A2I3_9CHLO|nr:Mitogen-activated protein kinase kinase kinase 11 [Tetrabaena socialis]|eukprot:PNH06725.1 Mitogen-activated protein kinase kinase kinase 11 [Tetrabaena socialis]